jgi:coenzyme F420-dependent glucose-6-phosphate dehydrogenase
MLEESVDVLRQLWTGETIEHAGTYFEVENARLFDPPSSTIPVMVSGFGPAAAELAGRIGDGLFAHGGDAEAVDVFRDAGGSGPTYGQINLCYGPDEAQCRKTVREIWPNGAIPGQLSQDLPTWTHFEQATELVTDDDVGGTVLCGPDRDAIVDRVLEYRDNGFDHIYFHQIGPDQQAFFDLWSQGLEADLHAG